MRYIVCVSHLPTALILALFLGGGEGTAEGEAGGGRAGGEPAAVRASPGGRGAARARRGVAGLSILGDFARAMLNAGGSRIRCVRVWVPSIAVKCLWQGGVICIRPATG